MTLQAFFQKGMKEWEEFFDDGIEEWRDILFWNKLHILEREFGKQKLELPPPDILKKMLSIEYPDWKKMANALAALWGHVPEPHGKFFVPIHDLVPFQRVIQNMFGVLERDATPEERLHPILKRYRENQHEVSERPRSEKPTSTHDLLNAYFRNTPFYELCTMCVHYEFSPADRLMHTMLPAGTRSGKSYFIESQVLADSGHKYFYLIIDPKDDANSLFNRLSKYKALRNRLILIDPDDVPGVNFFDVAIPRERAARLQALDAVYNSYAYFLREMIGSQLSDQMGTLMKALVGLLCVAPNSNFDTLIKCFEDLNPFRRWFLELPPEYVHFLEREYSNKEFEKTRVAVRRRLHEIKMSGLFGQIFSATKNMVDIPGWMDEGKIVIVHASEKKLPGLYRTLGRYFIAEAIRAAKHRKSTYPAFLIVDEASDFFDANTSKLLKEMAAYGLGGLFAFQYFDQAPTDVQQAMLANTHIRMFGGGHKTDARFLAPHYDSTFGEMSSTRRGQFIVHEVNSRRTFRLEVPTINEPLMTGEEYQSFRQLNRARLTPPPIEEENSGKVDTPGKPSSPSDDVPLDC